MLVYLPHDPHIGISQKIEDESGARPARALKELLPPTRKAASSCARGRERLGGRAARDIDYLRHLWRVIQERARGAAPPQLLYQDLSLAQRVLRDMVSAGTARVIVDSRENFQKLAAFADSYMPRVRGRLEHYTGERPLFDLYNVETRSKERCRGASSSSRAAI